MKLLDFTLTFLLITLSTVAFAQTKAASKASKLYKEKQFEEAIPFYEEAVAEAPNYTLRSRLAFCYKVTNQLKKAETAYSTLVYDDKVRPIAFKQYAETLMGSGKYAAAKFWLDEYIKEKPEDQQAKVLLQSCELVYTIKPYFEDVEINPFEFNSDFDDNAPVVLGEKLFFASDGASSGKTNGAGRGLMNVFSAENLEGAWTQPEKEGGKINTANNNSGPVSFTADGLTAVYCKNAPVANKAGQYPLQIYIAPVQEGKIKVGERVSACKLSSNYFQAAISPDGNTIVFSSDRGSGSSGGADLYQTKKTGDKWSIPTNLGEAINSAESEGFPFLTDDKLYFCSKGKLGFGGFDLYVSEKNSSGLWSEPVNLGFPINSSGDEMSIFVDKAGTTGVVSSTRDSGNDDLYFFGPKTGMAAVEQVTETEVEVEDEIPDFAKAAMAREEAELEKLKLEKIARAEAAKEAKILKEKQKAEAIAQAAIDREESLKNSTAKLEQVQTEFSGDPVESVVETENEHVINESKKFAVDLETGDTLYVGKKIVEPTLASTEVNIPKRKGNKKKKKVKKNKAVVDNSAKAVGAKMPEAEVELPKVEAPEVNTTVAEVNTPEVEMPEAEVELPKVETPEVNTTMAEVNTPEVEMPEAEVELPKVETPEVNTTMAKVNTPEVEMPEAEVELPKVETPEVNTTMAEVNTPEVEMPAAEVEIPKVETPVVNTTEVNTPEVEMPKVEAPEVKLPKAKKSNRAKRKAKEAIAEVKPVVDVKKPSLPIPSAPAVPTKMELGKAKMAVASLVADLQSNNTSANAYSLADLKYSFNATEVTPDLQAPLDELASVMKSNAGLKIKMIGHTGSIGSDAKNNRLSIARAAAAVDYLITKGVDPLNLSYEGKGETEILNGCHDGVLCGRTQHAENDRIEMIVQ